MSGTFTNHKDSIKLCISKKEEFFPFPFIHSASFKLSPFDKILAYAMYCI